MGPLVSRRRGGAVGDLFSSRRHAGADGDRDHHRRPARLLDRCARCAAPLFAVRYARNRRRHDRAVDPDLLVRTRHHLRVLGEARLAAGRQPADRRRWLLPRLAASSDRAGPGAGAGRDRDVGPLHALLHARGDQPGLHPHRARQGHAGMADPYGSRLAERAAADDHGGRPSVSDAARGRAGRRDRVHLAGHGPAVPRFHRLPRLSRGDGHPDVLGDHGADWVAARSSSIPGSGWARR
ncbi:hypothetical protein ABIB66_005334 [Bradyrhizobium sp. F1.13.3]